MLQLRDGIQSGLYPTGSLLTERDLAASLGISRTPLRSAIQQLERMGLLARVGKTALMVQQVSAEVLFELIDLRATLETAAARRAAGPLGDTRALAPLLIAQTAYLEGTTRDFPQFWADDDAFHLGVVKAAGLTLLPAILEDLRGETRRSLLLREGADFAMQASEHIAVLQAILKHQPDEAAAAMQRHFEGAKTRALHALAQRR